MRVGLSDDFLVFRELKVDKLAQARFPTAAHWCNPQPIASRGNRDSGDLLCFMCEVKTGTKIQSKTASYACRKLDMERAPARKKLVMTEADEPSLPLELAWVPYSTKPTLGLLARA